MNHTNIGMLDFKNVLRTSIKEGSASTMQNRYSSCIIIVIEGKLEFVFKEKSIVVEKERGIFISQGESYDLKGLEESENIILNFYTSKNDTPPFLLRHINGAFAESVFDKINFLMIAPEENRNKIMSLYYQLFASFFDKETSLRKTEHYVEQAKRLIATSFHKYDFSVSGIAEELNLSEIYLRKLFAKHLSVSPSKYILEIRMGAARSYLLQGFPVSVVAESCGYRDIYSFSRAYKNFFGHAPSKTI